MDHLLPMQIRDGLQSLVAAYPISVPQLKEHTRSHYQVGSQYQRSIPDLSTSHWPSTVGVAA
eukprot:132494-Rhodomonas_salina.2